MTVTVTVVELSNSTDLSVNDDGTTAELSFDGATLTVPNATTVGALENYIVVGEGRATYKVLPAGEYNDLDDINAATPIGAAEALTSVMKIVVIAEDSTTYSIYTVAVSE